MPEDFSLTPDEYDLLDKGDFDEEDRDNPTIKKLVARGFIRFKEDRYWSVSGYLTSKGYMALNQYRKKQQRDIGAE